MYMTWIALFAVKMAFSLSGFLNAKQRKSQNVCVCICEEAVRCGIWLQPTHLAIIALKGEHSVGYAQLSIGPRGQNVHTNAQWSV